MKSLTELWQQVALDMGDMCGVSTARDYQTVARRVKHEGVSFLTITLTQFARDLEKGLERGYVGPNDFGGFHRRQGLPLFLGGFLDRVFDRKTGRLLDAPCSSSVLAVRQLSLLFGKIALECSPERKEAALRKYVECEKEVRVNDKGTTPELREEFRVMSLKLFGDVLARLDRHVYEDDLVPKHGPGATADRLRGNSKFDLREWTVRLESVFPYGDYALPSWRYYRHLDSVDFREPGAERPVKVILVPKTLKTPRIIAIEPTCMQYMQQAVMEKLTGLLETDETVFGMIGFTRQSPNQRMAYEGSSDGGLATIDLSEASDRVSNQHVRLMLKHFPHLFHAVDATRSRKADVPGHGVIRLAKFASMGSALCFPIEAMVFLTAVFLGIQDAHGRRLTRGDIQSYQGRVRVYGDDIIVPVDVFSHVIARLTALGLKVNSDKTFRNGKFRESCGRDFYNGVDVTPVRVRHVFPSSRECVRELQSVVSLRNRLYLAGCWKAASWLDDWVKPLLGGHYPVVGPESPVLGRVSHLGYETQRMSPTLHRPEVRGWTVAYTTPASGVSGVGALMKCFLRRGENPFEDVRHLERAGRPEAVRTKLRWAPAY